VNRIALGTVKIVVGVVLNGGVALLMIDAGGAPFGPGRAAAVRTPPTS
jgi:hypothetical protein